MNTHTPPEGVRHHLTPFSLGKKLLGLPAHSSSSDTCPRSCPFNVDEGDGKRPPCYAKHGPQALHWSALDRGERGGSLEELCREIERFPRGQSWRYGVAGDLPGLGDVVDGDALDLVVSANNHRQGWAYTHKPVIDDHDNAEAIARANVNGFTVNLSANNLAHADLLLDMGIAPVASVVPDQPDDWKHARTPQGAQVVRCPAEYRDRFACRDCGKGEPLCARQRDYIIGFTPHGSRRKKLSEIARSYLPVID